VAVLQYFQFINAADEISWLKIFVIQWICSNFAHSKQKREKILQ